MNSPEQVKVEMLRRLGLLLLLVLAFLPSESRSLTRSRTKSHSQRLTSSFQPSAGSHQASNTEKEILDRLKRFFETEREAERKLLARLIEDDPAFDPAQMSDWLHRARLHGPLKAGFLTIAVNVEEGEKREVSIRIPKGYTPEKRWPLILAFHYTGGTGREMIELVEKTLGDRSDQFVMAAPTNYTPLNIDSRRSWKPEQRIVLRELRKLAHIVSDRIYVTGFSQGCYASWSYAGFLGDELAAAVPVACTFDAAPEIPGLWELLMPNVANVPVLHVWGSEDQLPVYGIDLRTVAGTAANLNQRVIELTKKLNLNILNFPIAGGRHTYDPPKKQLSAFLAKKRIQYPRTVRHRFRYLVQGRAYWLEALSWDGAQWDLRGLKGEANPGESRPQLIGRLIGDLVGQLDGRFDGQDISITQHHVGSFIVWLGEEMVDWQKSVKLSVNGIEVFRESVKRDLYLCLSEAARTYDFDRLRWSGLLVSKDGSVEMLSPASLPAVVYEKPAG